MNTALLLKDTDTKIKDIQSLDRNLLKDSVMITSFEEISQLINYLEASKSRPGTDIVRVNQRIKTLEAILDQRIILTARIMGIHESIEIPTAEETQMVNATRTEDLDQDLRDAQPEEQMMKTEKEDLQDRTIPVESKDTTTQQAIPEKSVKGKVIDAAKRFVNNVTNNESFFKGYTRTKVFGTATELPKDVQSLLSTVKTESDIDLIARKLVELDETETALNLSIDLFEHLKLKTRKEVEKRFLFEVYPHIFGVKIAAPESTDKLTLEFWRNHIISISEDNKLTTQLTTQAIEEIKADGEMKVATYNKINSSNLLCGSVKVFDDIKQALNITEFKVEVLPIIPKNKVQPTNEHIEDAVIVGLTMQTLVNECMTMLTSDKEIASTFEHFKKEINSVTDITDKDKKNVSALWGKNVMAPYKKKDKVVETATIVEPDKIETVEQIESIIAPEDKEKIIAAAEEAAAKGEEVIPSIDQIKTESRSVIKDAIASGKSALNAFNKYISKGVNKKALKNENTSSIFKEIKAEVEAETPKKIALFKEFDVKTTDPTVWDEALNCKTIEDFRLLIETLVFNKKMWDMAGNLVNQYLNNFEKDWDETTKTTWLKDVIATRKAKDLAKEEVSTTETTTETVEQPVETKEESVKPTESKEKDFSYISKESDKKRLTIGVGDFILDSLKNGKSIDEAKEALKPILKLNKKYRNTPDGDYDNAVKNIIKNNPDIQKLLA
jgi:hypothetical protein